MKSPWARQYEQQKEATEIYSSLRLAYASYFKGRFDNKNQFKAHVAEKYPELNGELETTVNFFWDNEFKHYPQTENVQRFRKLMSLMGRIKVDRQAEKRGFSLLRGYFITPFGWFCAQTQHLAELRKKYDYMLALGS